ncbi:MAG: efflux RND transporter periplasmic adaptor subunit [bacterium]
MIRKIIVVVGQIVIVTGLFFGLIGFLGSQRPKIEKTESKKLPPAVFYTITEEKPVNLFVYAQGEVQPRTEISLTTQVGGKVQSVADEFNDGGVIKKGQMLLQIEQEDYRLAVVQAEARVAQAAQTLDLEKAEAELALRDWQELGGNDDGSTPSALTLRKPQLAQAQANYNAALADLQNAKLSLKRTTIRAPFNGRVRRKNADIGQFIGPGTPVGDIFSTDVAEIRLPLADDELARLGLPLAFTHSQETPGPRVDLSTIVAGQMRHWVGHIVRTDAAIDPRTRQISAIVEVDDPYGAGADNGFPLAIGLYVDAAIYGRALPKAVMISAASLQTEDEVYVILDDDTIELRKVVIAASDKSGLVVIDGLHAGEKVVTNRIPGMHAGDTVTPLEQGSSLPRRQSEEKETAKTADTDNGSAREGAIQ